MAEMDEKRHKMAHKALTKSGAGVVISEDGTVSGSPVEYFKFLDAFIPEDAVNCPIDDLIKILAQQAAPEYGAVKADGLSYEGEFITPKAETALNCPDQCAAVAFPLIKIKNFFKHFIKDVKSPCQIGHTFESNSRNHASCYFSNVQAAFF